jgi:tRNA dimethylallyltransferase
MEVILATGRSLMEWQDQPPDGPPPGLRFRSVLLAPPRAGLYAAIDARFHDMAAKGALAEARALADRHLDPALPVMKALGVMDLARAAAGEIPLEAAIAAAQQASRNYAKRQMTWFRGQIVTDFRYFEKYSESLGEKILSEIL